jgi:hypothetical protein
MGPTESVAGKENAALYASVPERPSGLREEEPTSAVSAKPAKKAADCKFSRRDADSPLETDANSSSGE